jgi:CRP-like cAMP-binding protein
LLDETGQSAKRPAATVGVCSLTSRSYFGEEEIVLKATSRSHTAKVISTRCLTLELSKDKFEKLLENPEFE